MTPEQEAAIDRALSRDIGLVQSLLLRESVSSMTPAKLREHRAMQHRLQQWHDLAWDMETKLRALKDGPR